MFFIPFMSFITSDLRYALRRMRRSPGFTVVGVTVLALGIGVNTALFSIVNALFFRPLQVRAPEQLLYVYSTNLSGQVTGMIQPDDFEFLRVQAADLVEFTSHTAGSIALSVDGETERVSGEYVRSSYFDLLGVKPALGRVIGPGEDDPSNPEPAVVISDDLWRRRFNADPGVIGTRVGVRNRPFTIVGVMPPGFRGLADFWTPSQFWATAEQAAPGRRFAEGIIARLKPGVTFDQFRAFIEAKTPELRQRRLDTLTPALRDKYGDSVRKSHYPVVRATDQRMPFTPRREVVPRGILIALTFVVGLVLFIAAINIAGLLLARGVTRAGEIAVRRALGAGGARLTSQLLTEAVLLSLMGGALGLFIAWNVVSLFRALTPASFVIDVSMDLRVLMFAVAVCIGAGVVVGMAPALQAVRVSVLEALGTGIAGTRGVRHRLKYWIVIPQVGSSLVLLIVAGIHVRSLARVELTDLGYSTDQIVLSFWREEPFVNRAGQPRPSAEEMRANAEDQARTQRTFRQTILDRVQLLPGVSSHALSSSLVARDLPNPEAVASEDAVLAGRAPIESAIRTVVSGGYFAVMNTRILSGRTFDERDALNAPKVAIVSEALGQRLWPGRSAIGKRLTIDDGQGKPPTWFEVIGVVNETRPLLTPSLAPRYYVPVSQQWRPDVFNLLVRGSGDRAALVSDLKKTVSGADAYAEVSRAQTMEQIVDEMLYPRRTAAAVLLAAGVIGLLLACVGLSGVVSYAVAQRSREIGIRSTLGAGRRDLILLLLRDGARATAVGSAIGLAMAYVSLRLTARIIPDLPTIDVLIFLFVPPVIAVVVLLSCYIPARRAASVDPSQVLRSF